MGPVDDASKRGRPENRGGKVARLVGLSEIGTIGAAIVLAGCFRTQPAQAVRAAIVVGLRVVRVVRLRELVGYPVLSAVIASPVAVQRVVPC